MGDLDIFIFLKGVGRDGTSSNGSGGQTRPLRGPGLPKGRQGSEGREESFGSVFGLFRLTGQEPGGNIL